jgi:hypothetical protein
VELDGGEGGRYRPGARLTLANPELMEDWPRARENVFVKNKVSFTAGGKFILPTSYRQKIFWPVQNSADFIFSHGRF